MALYDINYIDEYIDELLDKIGSDYFPLPIKMKRFTAQAYGFIHEHTKNAEATQEISDAVKPLLVKLDTVLIAQSEAGLYNMPEPSDYLRMVSLVPLFLAGSQLINRSKKVTIITEGQRQAYARDPFQNATPEYPQVSRFSNIFEINVGIDDVVYTTGRITYFKKPTFGIIGTDRAINLPNLSIEKICQLTAESLRMNVEDDSAPNIVQYDTLFGQKR